MPGENRRSVGRTPVQLLLLKCVRVQVDASSAKKKARNAAWASYKGSQGAYAKNLAAYKAAKARYVTADASYPQVRHWFQCLVLL